MQRLLRTAVWDDTAVRADVRRFVVEHLDDEYAVLLADETGCLKRPALGRGPAPVLRNRRTYREHPGRSVLSDASPKGRSLIDCGPYVPKSLMADPDLCAAAGIPADLPFATKPQLARQMIDAALDAGIRVGWMTADEAYVLDPFLRAALQERGVGYVLAVA